MCGADRDDYQAGEHEADSGENAIDPFEDDEEDPFVD